MTNLTWTDSTSYAQGERGHKPQASWETILDGTRVWVSRGHAFYPNEWVMYCGRLGIRDHTIGSTDMSSERARNMAVNIVWEEAKRQAAELEGLADAAFAAHPAGEGE